MDHNHADHDRDEDSYKGCKLNNMKLSISHFPREFTQHLYSSCWFYRVETFIQYIECPCVICGNETDFFTPPAMYEPDVCSELCAQKLQSDWTTFSRVDMNRTLLDIVAQYKIHQTQLSTLRLINREQWRMMCDHSFASVQIESDTESETEQKSDTDTQTEIETRRYLKMVEIETETVMRRFILNLASTFVSSRHVR